MSLFRRKTALQPSINTRAFDLLSLTMAFVLVVHVPHLPWWLSVSFAIALAARWWQRHQQQGRVPRWIKLPLLLLLLLAVTGYYGSIFGRLPGSALAIGLLALKLLETDTARDARVGAGFACFALMAALLFDQGLLDTFVVALGLLPALACLRALEPAQAPISLPRSLAGNVGLLIAAVPLTLLAFVLVPRLSTPLWGARSPDQARTGLSSSMSPGNFTELLTDDHTAMRVTFDGLPPAPDKRYFRAYVMDRYDGRTWSYDDAADRAPATLLAGKTIRYQISLEADHQRVLPTLDVPLSAPSNAMVKAHMRADRVVMANKAVDDPIHYNLTSATQYELEPTLEGDHGRWLKLPPGFNPQTRALAARWRQRFGGNDSAVVQAALTLFHDGGFHYTLAPAPLGRNAVDDFLFNTREGFCEHYASAFTVLMRAAGIPARVVTGYQGGYWNKFGSYLLVRYSDAHAWSEVWLAGRGWVRVDPTAAVRPERLTLGAAAAAGNQLPWYQDAFLQGMRNHWDIVNRWWNQGVVGFDALRQQGLLTPFGVDHTDTTTLGILLALSSVLFMSGGLIWALRRRPTRDPLLASFKHIEKKLARKGLRRRHNEGPLHYLSRSARALPGQRDQLMLLMYGYVELRYAHVSPPPELLRKFRRAAGNFRVGSVVQCE